MSEKNFYMERRIKVNHLKRKKKMQKTNNDVQGYWDWNCGILCQTSCLGVCADNCTIGCSTTCTSLCRSDCAGTCSRSCGDGCTGNCRSTIVI